MATMIKLDGINDYLVVPVECHTAMRRGESKIVRTETVIAKAIAIESGFDPRTIQRMTRDCREYYTFKR